MVYLEVYEVYHVKKKLGSVNVTSNKIGGSVSRDRKPSSTSGIIPLFSVKKNAIKENEGSGGLFGSADGEIIDDLLSDMSESTTQSSLSFERKNNIVEDKKHMKEKSDKGKGSIERNQEQQKSTSRPAISKPSAPPVTNTTSTSLSNIIESQQFNGSWNLETLKKLHGSLTPSLLKDNLPSSLAEKYNVLENALITAIVVVYFNNNFSSQKTLWELIVKKANIFIKKEITSAGLSPESCDLTSIATKILTSIH